MIVDFYKGFRSPLLATFYVLRNSAVWKYIFIPICFMVFCLLSGLVLLYMFAPSIMESLSTFGVHPPKDDSPAIQGIGYYVLYLGIWVTGLFFSYMIAMLIAPILSEPISSHLVDKRGWQKCIHDGAKTQPFYTQIGESIILLMAQLCCAVVCFFWGLIPLLGLFAPVVFGIVTNLVLTKELLDIPLARHGISFSQKIQIIRTRIFLFLGFGAAVLFMALIPLYNLLLFPIAVIAITQVFYEHIWSENKELLLTTKK